MYLYNKADHILSSDLEAQTTKVKVEIVKSHNQGRSLSAIS